MLTLWSPLEVECKIGLDADFCVDMQVAQDDEIDEDATVLSSSRRRGELSADEDEELDEDDPLFSMSKTQAR